MQPNPAMCEIELNLAGVPFDVRVEGPCPPENIEARFGAYRRGRCALPELSPGASLRVSVTEAWQAPRDPLVPFPGTVGEVLADGSISFLRVTELVGWDAAARRGTSECRRPPSQLPPVVDPTPIDTPLRLILSQDLPPHGGLLVHAAGYGDDRGAVAFLAPSGGGKTTTTRKLPGENVLSDDQVALRKVDGAWRAFALPFIGEYATATVPRVTPLRAIVLLEKAPSLSLARVGGGRALARVMGCVVRFTRGPGGAELLALSASLVEAVPVYVLGIARDEPVMPVVERLLA